MKQLIAVSLILGGTVVPNVAYAKSKDDNQYKTRIFVSQNCAPQGGSESIFSTLAGIVLKPAVEASIKGVGNAVKKAGEDKVTTKKANQATHFYSVELGEGAQDETSVDLNVGCITIVDGALSKAKTDDQKKDESKQLRSTFRSSNGGEAIGSGDGNKFLNPIPGSNVRYYSSDIRFYAQYRVKISEDQSAFRLEPVEALVGRPFGKSKKSKERNLEIVISFNLPAANDEGKTHAVTTSSFKKVKSYRHFPATELTGKGTGWMPMPTLTENIVARVSANQKRRIDLQALQDKRAVTAKDLTAPGLTSEKKQELEKLQSATNIAIGRLKDLIKNDNDVISLASPMSINVSVVETQKGSKFLQKLGEFLVENREKIGKPIFEAIDPTTKSAANVAALDTEDTLRIAAIEAVANYQLEEAKTGSDRSESKIKVAKIKAQQACRKLRAEGHEDLDCLGF